MKKKIIGLALDFRIIGGMYVLIVLITSFQACFPHAPLPMINGIAHTYYNNFVIFRQSFFHLIHHQNLYVLYPYEHWDLYKYSPTFSMFMAPMAFLPDILGLLLWNLLNALPLFFAIRYLPGMADRSKAWALWLVLLELLITLRNAQSNGLMAGLLIAAFVFLERKNCFMAALLIVFTIFIKLFGIVAFALFLLYPGKLKSAAYSLVWFIILLALPLAAVSVHHLMFLYFNWGKLLAADHTGSLGISVMGWLHAWFPFDPPKNLVVVAGMVLFGIPLLRIKMYENGYFRMLLLSSVLIWIIIFNHKAESPTFVIAVSGIALWLFSLGQWSPVRTLVLIATLTLTCFNTSDLYPQWLRDFLFTYKVKAIPCIFAWGLIMHDLITMKDGAPGAPKIKRPAGAGLPQRQAPV